MVTYSIIIAIGVAQGLILGEAIIERFPRLQHHTKLASILLFMLFAVNATVNVIKFADPDKINISQILASSPDQIGSMILKLAGLSAGAASVIALSTTLLIFILLKFTTLKEYSKAFLLIISVIMIIVAFIIRFSDYMPASFEIFLYVLYQAGITGGIVWGMRRKLYSKELRLRYFCERWTGKLVS